MLTPNSRRDDEEKSAPPSCRACAGAILQTVLDLGMMPLANALLDQSQIGRPEPRFPLVLAFCPDCSLVQIIKTVSPERLFRHYFYFSSFSEALLDHARTLARRMIETRRLGRESLVMEIASNDGYLLQYYRQEGVPVLGIEPAENVAKEAQEKRGIPTICEFFGSALAGRLCQEGRRADVIHAHNVLGHVPDLNGFMKGLSTILKERGTAVIEAPYVKDMIDRVEFDTIYHEHLSYFSLTALDRLSRSHRLLVRDVERLSIHGGSLRAFLEHQAPQVRPTQAVRDLLAAEKEWGVDRMGFYQDFGARVRSLNENLMALLRSLKSQGRRIAAYGASAKGSTLLNYAGIDQKILDFVVDRSTAKQGFYTPGAHLPIYAPEKLLEAMPDYALLLTWNFAGEILQQQAEYQRRGGRFIIPIPQPQVIEA